MKANGLTKETILDYGVTERNFPTFRAGDRIEVSMLIQDKGKERVQKFEGDVIAMRTHGISSTFKVRKLGEGNIGIELTLPYYSPSIQDIKMVREGKVRRAKLFYLRDRKGQKANKIKRKYEFNRA